MVSVILPTYNESENIKLIVPQIFDVLTTSGLKGEVIIVDDNSPDGTAETGRLLARDYPLKVHVRKDERGLATAVMKGFELASGDICVVLDADLSHPVDKIAEMVKPILEGKCDATVGSRYTNGGGCEDWPFMRRFISKFSGLLARGLTRLSDPTSGFMAIRKDSLKGVRLDPVGWKIVLEAIVKSKARLYEVPIIFSDRQRGESKLDTRVQAQYVVHLWRLYCFKYPPLFQFTKFCTVGFLGLLVDTAALMTLVEITHLDPRVAAIFAFVVAVSFNYSLNRLWTFNSVTVSHLAASYGWFLTVCIAGLFVRIGVMHLVITLCNMGSGYRYIVVSIIGILVATMFNFVGTKFIVFSGKLSAEKNPA